jgi:hypothetical protein
MACVGALWMGKGVPFVLAGSLGETGVVFLYLDPNHRAGGHGDFHVLADPIGLGQFSGPRRRQANDKPSGHPKYLDRRSGMAFETVGESLLRPGSQNEGFRQAAVLVQMGDLPLLQTEPQTVSLNAKFHDSYSCAVIKA